MNKSELLSRKIEELVSSLDALMKNPSVSDNTKRTQKFQRTKEIRTLIMMRALIDESGFSADMEKWFLSLVTLTSERKETQQVEVNKGDMLVDLLNKYADKTNVYNKLIKAAELKGLKLNLDHFE